MGILDSAPIAGMRAKIAELAERAITSAVKSALIPAGSTQPSPLPREDFGANSAFGPGVPLLPTAIDPRQPGAQQPAPRRNDFQSSVNMQVTSTRLLPFTVLRDVAERVDIIRRCVEVRKAQILSFEWDITLSKSAVKQIMLADNIKSPGEAAQLARRKLEPEMARLRTWWEKPDPFNGMDFETWLGLVLEEQLVVDAVSLWPRHKMNGEVVAIEVIDGATIKPLLDYRGSTPAPPNAAYQQILKGFPRGEFIASDTGLDDGYRFDQIMYRPRYRRTWTPYGCPNTEQALSAADIYLKRMSWMRNEFDEGTTPDTWIKNTDQNSKMKASDVAAWEKALNDLMAGQNAERRHLHMLPPGYEPDQMQTFESLYKPDLDEFLIKLLCACFDIMPTEIGFPPGSGIGGKGHQEGEANSSQRKAVRPTATWINGLITDISRTYLGMPPELCFTLLGYELEDQNAAEVVADSIIRRGGSTLNEDRARRGQPMYPFANADRPFMVTPTGLMFLDGGPQMDVTGPGEVETPAPPAELEPTNPIETTATAVYTGPEDTPVVGDVIADDTPVPDGYLRIAGHLRRKATPAAVAEVQKFLTFATKRAGRTWRDFEFGDVDVGTASALNAAGRDGDIDLVKTLVADVGKARARIVGRAAKDKLIKTHAGKIADALAAMFPAPDALIGGFTATKALTDNQVAAQAYLETQLDESADMYDDLDGEIESFMKAGHKTAYGAAWISDDVDVADKPESTALQALLDKLPDARDVLIGIGIGLLADALISHDPAGNVADVIDGHEFVDSFAGTQLTAAVTAGTLDSSQKQGINVVRIVASDGDCEFCQGYDGRILHLDETDGMPPLHRGCSCDIEPLD